MSDKKRIALITTWFPPQQSVAANRMDAFAVYLSESFDVEIFCLDEVQSTKKLSDSITVHTSTSTTILDKIKENRSDSSLKHKAKTAIRILLSKLISSPLKKWQELTIKKIKEVHFAKPFDIIISSYAPIEAHLVAVEFLKEFSTVPWIADMRDEMSKNYYLSISQKLKLREHEIVIDRYATAITSVSLPILKDYQLLCPAVPNCLEIRNGYNHTFKRDLDNNKKNSVFTMGYFGTFYGANKPDNFLAALKELKTEKPDFNFEFHMYGVHRNFTIPQEIKECIKLFPAVKYEEAIQRMMEMDANVLFDPFSDRKGVFTGKLFDYISVQRPIIACTDTNDVAAEMILEFDCGYVAEFSDVKENKAIVLKAFSDWENEIFKFANTEHVDSIHRKKQVEKLDKLIQKLLTT